MSTAAAATDWYRGEFARYERGLNGASHSPVHALRRRGLETFAARGFPATSDEEWRFTNVEAIAGARFLPMHTPDAHGVTAADVRRWSLTGREGIVLVFLNGHFAPELSSIPPLPHGAHAGSLAHALEADPSLALREFSARGGNGEDAFGALNSAFLADGAYIRVDDGVTLDVPVHILALASPGRAPVLIQPRHVIRAGRGSRLSVIETYGAASAGVYLTNGVTEIAAGEEAVVEHDTLQLEGTSSYHVRATLVTLAAKSSFTSNAVSLGGLLVRNHVGVEFTGEGAECTLNGLSVATGKQHVDNHTVIDHARPRCESHELYKSVLDGASRGVFNGKIFVRPDAQKTDARQTNRTLLLSEEAIMNTKPQLEIFADDVKCTHGAAVGQLDEDQVFYLRARGIGEIQARDLLTFAFATDVISRVHVEALRDSLDALLHSRLRQGRVKTEA